MEPTNHSFRKHLAIGGVTGIIAGTWPALWWVALISSLEDRWFFIGLKIPDGQPLKSLMTTADRMSGYAAETFHISLLAHPVNLMAVMAGGGFLAGLLVVCLNRLIKFDPEWLSFKAVKWTLKSCVKRWQNALIVFGSIPILTVIIWMVDDLDSVWLFLAVPVCLLVLLIVIPFQVIHSEVVSSDIAGPWWRKNPWPGWKVALAVICLISISVLFSILLDFLFPQTVPAFILREALGIGIGSVFGSAIICSLLGRDLEMLKKARFLRWRIIGPYLSQHVPGLLFASLIAGPFLAICLIMWRIVPALANIYQGYGLKLPLVWSFAIHLFHLWEQWGLLIIILPVVLIGSLLLARLVWLAGFSMESGSTDSE